MELIIDFYKSLDTLNLIIFWGVIIVIILLLIFSFIMINKNKKLKKIVEENNKYEEELPIKKEEVTVTNVEKTISEEPIIHFEKEENEEKISETEIVKNTTENNNLEQNYNVENNSYIEKQQSNNKNVKQPIEMPTGPYQRNVLREMSLSQTSPIGINRKERNEEIKVELAKDLENSLNHEPVLDVLETIQNIKKDLSNIEDTSPRKTHIIDENNEKEESVVNKKQEIESLQNNQLNVENTKIINEMPKELIEIDLNIQEEKSTSEQYLEEVSQKLAEAEIPDGIERTNYELQQEEDAIISYKELMEKKDTIQTIDEEDAIISIEELMNRENNKQSESSTNEDSKLYNLNESGETDDFIKELKQFRKDL